MNLVIVALKAIFFFFLAVVLWVVGTLFHGFLWWSLGLDGVPTLLPYMNLAFLPFAFFTSWLVTFLPRKIHCEQCQRARMVQTLTPVSTSRAA